MSNKCPGNAAQQASFLAFMGTLFVAAGYAINDAANGGDTFDADALNLTQLTNPGHQAQQNLYVAAAASVSLIVLATAEKLTRQACNSGAAAKGEALSAGAGAGASPTIRNPLLDTGDNSDSNSEEKKEALDDTQGVNISPRNIV